MSASKSLFHVQSESGHSYPFRSQHPEQSRVSVFPVETDGRERNKKKKKTRRSLVLFFMQTHGKHTLRDHVYSACRERSAELWRTSCPDQQKGWLAKQKTHSLSPCLLETTRATHNIPIFSFLLLLLLFLDCLSVFRDLKFWRKYHTPLSSSFFLFFTSPKKREGLMEMKQTRSQKGEKRQ